MSEPNCTSSGLAQRRAASKGRRGELRMGLPVGLIHTPFGRRPVTRVYCNGVEGPLGSG